MAKRLTKAQKAAALTVTQAPAEEATGTTVEQHLRDLGLIGGPEPKSVVEPDLMDDGLLEVTLFDVTPIQINGQLTHLPKGKQRVAKNIFNVLRDANLITT